MQNNTSNKKFSVLKPSIGKYSILFTRPYTFVGYCVGDNFHQRIYVCMQGSFQSKLC